MPAFGLNDDLIKPFGLNDDDVGQPAVTQPPVVGGTGQVANAAGYVPKRSQYSEAYVPSEDMPGAMTGMGPTRPVQNYTDQQMAGARAGVNIDAPPVVDTARANTYTTKRSRDQKVAMLIKQAKGPDTPVRFGSESKTGDVEWYDQDAGQWKQAGNSFGGKMVNAAPEIGEAVGALAGTYTPAPGTLSTVGAAVGRGGTVAAINAIGRRFEKQDIAAAGGQPENYDPRNEEKSATTEATKAAVFTGGMNVLTNGIPLAYRLAIKGKDVATPGMADSIINSYNKNAGFVQDINESMEKNGEALRYEPNIGRVAALPDERGISNPDAQKLVVNEPLLIRTNKELSDRELTRRANRENVIELYAQNEVFNPEATANITQANWQERVKQYYDAWKEGRLGPYQKAVDDALDQASAAAGQQGRGQLDEVAMGRMVRDVITSARDQSKGRVTSSWADYESKAGFKPGTLTSDYQVPLTKQLASTMNVLDSLKKKSLLKSQAAQAERYTPTIKDDAPKIVDVNGKPFNEGGTVDLAMLDRTIKDLNREASQAAKGTVASDISDSNRNMLLKNLKKAREEFLADKPELSTALAKANAETARHAQEFKDSYLGTFLVRDNAYGDMRVADPKILDSVMRNKDKLAATQLAEMVKGEPGAKQAIVDYVDAFYNDKFTRKLADGTRQLDPKKHQTFVDQVLPNLRPFLTDAEYSQFGRLGGIAQNVVQQKEAWRQANKAFRALDPSNVGGKLNSETLIGNFFDPNKSDKNFRFIQNHLGDDAMQSTKSGIMAAIAQKARDPRTGLIDPSKLAGVIDPIRDRMLQYFGAARVKAIDNVIRAAQAEKLEVSGKTLTGDTVVTSVARPILGPLSSENRKLTALKQLRERNTAYRVEAAMYDPNELARLAGEIQSRSYNAGARSRAGYIILKSTEHINDNN